MKNAINKGTTKKGTFYSVLPARRSLLLMSILLSFTLSACSFPTIKSRETLESKPFGGTIVDDETGKPIANAVVMMNWPRKRGGYTGSSTIGAIEVAESVTDAKGRYAIDGWFKHGKDEVFEGGFAYKTDPKMVIFAPGYWPTQKRNPMRRADPLVMANDLKDVDILHHGEAWKAEWDGEAIGLKPTHREKWNYEQQQEYRSSIESYMGFYFMPKCSWLKIPNYYLARHRALTKETNGGHTVLTGFLTKYRRTLEKSCGVDPKEFFLSHGMTNKEFDNCCSGQARPSQLEPVGTFLLTPEEEKSSGVKK